MEILPTMKDVADRAGVHPSTVSRVLSNSPRVTAKTREKVRAAVQSLGYRPNPYISILMRNRRQRKTPEAKATLALLTTFPSRDGTIKEFPLLESAFEAARRQARVRGFNLEELWAPLDRMSSDRLNQILHTRSISGILLAPFPRPMETFGLNWDRVAVVAWGLSLLDPRVHRVRSNHFGSLAMAMDECHRLGYRRVGLALRQETNVRAGKRWEAAYYLKQRELGIENPPAAYLASNWTKEPFLRWLDRERPDAILCYTRYGMPFEWLESEGIKVPKEVGVASLACSQGGQVSGVLESWELQAVRGINLVIDLLADNAFGLHDCPNVSVVDAGWNPGETLLQVPGRA